MPQSTSNTEKGKLPVRTLKIYLDNCCFNRPFDNQALIRVRIETEAKLYIQAGIRNKDFSLCWSYMLDYENNENPYEEKRNAIAPWKEIADDYCPSSDTVLSRGQEIMKRGINSKDALHIACAIEMYCEYFITTDKKLANKSIMGIKIINPTNFVGETEDIQ